MRASKTPTMNKLYCTPSNHTEQRGSHYHGASQNTLSPLRVSHELSAPLRQYAPMPQMRSPVATHPDQYAAHLYVVEKNERLTKKQTGCSLWPMLTRKNQSIQISPRPDLSLRVSAGRGFFFNTVNHAKRTECDISRSLYAMQSMLSDICSWPLKGQIRALNSHSCLSSHLLPHSLFFPSLYIDVKKGPNNHVIRLLPGSLPGSEGPASTHPRTDLRSKRGVVLRQKAVRFDLSSDGIDRIGESNQANANEVDSSGPKTRVH